MTKLISGESFAFSGGEKSPCNYLGRKTNNVLYSHAQRQQTGNYETSPCHIKAASEKINSFFFYAAVKLGNFNTL